MTDRLFSIDEIPEVPIFREPRRVGARLENDARFRNDYPPEWDKCTACDGKGKVQAALPALLPPGGVMLDGLARYWEPCIVCLGMGSLKARVRREAGHRCIRCKHPYMPKGDAKMLGVDPSGLHTCERCGGSGRDPESEPTEHGTKYNCVDCKGEGQLWTPWSACDEQCSHGGPVRVYDAATGDATDSDDPRLFLHPRYPDAGAYASDGFRLDAVWRILTVHHFDGDKANVRWWNLGALCQRCHLHIQHKVIMERVYPHEHSPWFKPFVAGYYAWVYLQEDLSRPEVEERLDELLALELATA